MIWFDGASENLGGEGIGNLNNHMVVGGRLNGTAAYGSIIEPHVMTLRQLRNRFLTIIKMEKGFVRHYYQYSQAIADNIS